MEEWKKINGHFLEAASYRHTTMSPNRDVWVSMCTTPKDVRLFAGFVNNYETPIIEITCGNSEKKFLEIEPIIQKVINCSPKNAPFSMILTKKINKGYITSGQIKVLHHQYREAKRRSEKQKAEGEIALAAISNEQIDVAQNPELNFSCENDEIKKEENQMNFADEREDQKQDDNVLKEEGQAESALQPENVLQSEYIIEESSAVPIANVKRLSITQDEFLEIMGSVKTKSPPRDDILYDLRLKVWNPPADPKENDGKRNRKSGYQRWSYKISFGRFFVENNLHFHTLLIGSGEVHGKTETLLMFDSEFHKEDEATVEIMAKTEPNKKKRMPRDISKPKLAIQLIENAGLKVNQRLGYTSEFTWNVCVFELKGLVNQYMFLTNMNLKTYPGPNDPTEQEENNSEENNLS